MTTPTVRLTTAQALVRHLAGLRVIDDDAPRTPRPYVAGVFAIFGHGNVAGLGEALASVRETLPTLRAHNEQAMAHAAIAYAKAQFRRRVMAVTTSIGPGATNLVTAAALAHVNRLPVLLLPGDVFASRAPDPVLQQIEDFHHGDVSVNDCLRPVTRYFDRILRPEQILTALPRAIDAMIDPAACGPACIALPQDVQCEAFDCPEEFLAPRTLRPRRPLADSHELQAAARALRGAQRPLIIAGGGVLYSRAGDALRAFAMRHGVPVAETQAGKSSLPWNDALNTGSIGVSGSPAANALAAHADLVFAVGTRLQDFTTGSHALFGGARVVALNANPIDAAKWHALPLVADVRAGLAQLDPLVEGWRCEPAWTARAQQLASQWRTRVATLTGDDPSGELPYEADVIGAVQRSAADSPERDIVVCAAGTLPAELHKLWRAGAPGGYHVEYGYSCMGYEIAGGLGVKLAQPKREVVVMVGDGSYLMLNSELATAALLGLKLIVVLLDNGGFGCIHRLQRASGAPRFNNLLDDCVRDDGARPAVDFAAHARSLGVEAVRVAGVRALEDAMRHARAASTSQVIVVETTPERVTADGGAWWEVALPEVSTRAEVAQARGQYAEHKRRQRP